uniref:Oxygen regulatory protein NreC n=1 Tax=Serratia marcescens TaxID=615 RepID=A0A1C3HLZ9_SERMA|nr:Oxygen regulatory protein NreC [Serratia marcescens]
MKNINVIIDDDNNYFSSGLQSSINEYAQVNNKTVCFLTQDTMARPDVIFVSSRRIAQRWPRATQEYGCPAVVTIKERSVTSQKAPRVLYRTDTPDTLFVLLTEVLSDTRATKRFEHHPFTHRERQVVNYLKKGLGQSQTARVMGVSVKTVHSHKRSVMNKLKLSRNHDFIYWLLSQ